jgi:hypothetical protein
MYATWSATSATWRDERRLRRGLEVQAKRGENGRGFRRRLSEEERKLTGKAQQIWQSLGLVNVIKFGRQHLSKTELPSPMFSVAHEIAAEITSECYVMVERLMQCSKL